MTIWLVEPRDPLIVREGRPFGPDPGAWAASLPFPFPSTLAGGVRTRSALDENGAFKYGRDDKKQLEQLKEICVRGPLLVQLADDGDDIAAWLVPMPNDAQLFADGSNQTALLRRLVPLDLPDGAQTDFSPNWREKLALPARAQANFDLKGREQLLHFVGQEGDTHSQPRKPLTHKLRYWYWEPFQIWLTNPARLENEQGMPLSSLVSALGHEELIRESRLHVSMDSTKEMGKEGLLFGTSGLEFTHPGEKEKRLHYARRLALAVDVDGGEVVPGVAGFGGERRIVTWRQGNMQLPQCPVKIKEAIIKECKGHCRLVLLTPACFAQGYYPTWLRMAHAKECGVEVDLRAIAVRRPQIVSGWDLALGKPKPSRRLAPAGTVLFLSVRGDDAALTKWIEKTWMQCVSDEEQDRRDGFGLAVLGTWSGQPVAMR
jgi:CRISPR-associated protein Cmr3